MDGIKITKRDTNALQRTLTSAIAANKDTKPILQKWLMLYIAAVFKMRSSKNERQDYTQQQLISLLRENGIAEANIKDKTDYNHNKSYSYSRNDFWHQFEVQFKNYNVSFSDYRGGDATGNYRGINAYFFGRYHNVNLGFITAEQAASTLMELDMLIPQWIEQEWPAFMLEAQKAAKIRNINENTIETLIKAKLDGTGITYHIEKQKLRVKTYFNIGCGMQVEWFISHKDFMQQIDNVIKAVKIIKETAEATGSVFTAKAIDKSIRWQ